MGTPSIYKELAKLSLGPRKETTVTSSGADGLPAAPDNNVMDVISSVTRLVTQAGQLSEADVEALLADIDVHELLKKWLMSNKDMVYQGKQAAVENAIGIVMVWAEMAKRPMARGFIREMGIMSLVPEFLGVNVSDELANQALRVVGNATFDHPENRDYVYEHQRPLVAKMIHCLEHHPNSIDIVKTCCGSILNLTLDHEKLPNLVVQDLGLFEHLMPRLDRLVKEACPTNETQVHVALFMASKMIHALMEADVHQATMAKVDGSMGVLVRSLSHALAGCEQESELDDTTTTFIHILDLLFQSANETQKIVVEGVGKNAEAALLMIARLAVNRIKFTCHAELASPASWLAALAQNDNVLEFIYQTPFIVDLFMSMMKIESISPQIMLVFGNMARSDMHAQTLLTNLGDQVLPLMTSILNHPLDPKKLQHYHATLSVLKNLAIPVENKHRLLADDDAILKPMIRLFIQSAWVLAQGNETDSLKEAYPDFVSTSVTQASQIIFYYAVMCIRILCGTYKAGITAHEERVMTILLASEERSCAGLDVFLSMLSPNVEAPMAMWCEGIRLMAHCYTSGGGTVVTEFRGALGKEPTRLLQVLLRCLPDAALPTQESDMDMSVTLSTASAPPLLRSNALDVLALFLKDERLAEASVGLDPDVLQTCLTKLYVLMLVLSDQVTTASPTPDAMGSQSLQPLHHPQEMLQVVTVIQSVLARAPDTTKSFMQAYAHIVAKVKVHWEKVYTSTRDVDSELANVVSAVHDALSSL